MADPAKVGTGCAMVVIAACLGFIAFGELVILPSVKSAPKQISEQSAPAAQPANAHYVAAKTFVVQRCGSATDSDAYHSCINEAAYDFSRGTPSERDGLLIVYPELWCPKDVATNNACLGDAFRNLFAVSGRVLQELPPSERYKYEQAGHDLGEAATELSKRYH